MSGSSLQCAAACVCVCMCAYVCVYVCMCECAKNVTAESVSIAAAAAAMSGMGPPSRRDATHRIETLAGYERNGGQRVRGRIQWLEDRRCGWWRKQHVIRPLMIVYEATVEGVMPSSAS
ncbi:unnamed protein product [Cercopithifilaria johnstoni]|uniref:Secreted protein n=1 Tax=Cercopithifilaria johnstoni TaxID=2874296 RepID=A0A8J2PZ29_9BILA|nr:unnamed protein product [Cercopithifilaria johnstoni]